MMARGPWLRMPLDGCAVHRPPMCEPSRSEGKMAHEGGILFAFTVTSVPILEPSLGLLKLFFGLLQNNRDPRQGVLGCQVFSSLFVPQVSVVLYQLARLPHPDHA